ncbi:uncharacterized protein A1O9_08476 [Exophiala aquamarina CBS 119918]|uniref:Uncharacterized protein n=1 Tax=Exophiala aquamarina CBS 119918 TaxID=1182545 RepID=A0A072P7B8_9EURO|nr:uncharacterized protein A1O9_08476 [Exophiala aquamarina CBS 119918]KEF55726.1 hypothetical protein A1O9_08476 [Exophiala aquamarina CBS 119918]
MGALPKRIHSNSSLAPLLSYSTLPPFGAVLCKGSARPAAVGYLYTGPFIGGTLGVILMVMTSDPLCGWVARKNGGIYEPEFRIYPIVIAVATGAIGLFLFGSMIDAGKGYYVGSVLHGIYGISVNVAGAVMNAYVVDAYIGMH